MKFLIASLLLLFGLRIYFKYRRALNSVRHHPGLRLVIAPDIMLSNILPRIPPISLGVHWGLELKHCLFSKAGWDVLSIVSIFPRVRTSYLIADPLAVKEMILYRARFPKPIWEYDLLAHFGQNIVITEAEEWKKHRKISGPSFSDRNFKLVWDETMRIMSEMFEEWGSNKEVVIEHSGDITLKITLLVLSVAAFGRRIAWREDSHVPPGHKLSFRDALHTFSAHIQATLITPTWVYPFSKLMRRLQLSQQELQTYLEEMISERRAMGDKEKRWDLFSALLDANDQDKEGYKLTDQELIGNVFVFLIAGHETTGHTLIFALGLLALEQDEQEKLYRHILSVLPEGQVPTYDQINLLTYSMAVLYETLRLFPPVMNIPKYSAEDTTLPAVQPNGSTGSLVVPKGSKLTISVAGLHNNPRYWLDPDTFNPSRFLGDWPRFAFIPFSAGARACIGRRFAEIETIIVITMLVKEYKIELKNPEMYDGLTAVEKRKRLLAYRQELTTTPVHVPLVFKKRGTF